MNPSVAKAMLEVAVNKGIKDIMENPQRGTRQLVDLATHFASNRFQKEFSLIAQNLLQDPESLYYQIVADVVNQTAPTILKTFGTNFGYHSLTLGAGMIRQHESAYGYKVPWTIVVEMDAVTGSSFDASRFFSLVEQGKEVGIYTYMIFLSRWNSGLLEVFQGHEDCAFILFVPPGIIARQQVQEIAAHPNVMLSVNLSLNHNEPAADEAISMLQQHNCLYAIHGFYSDSNIEPILSHRWVQTVSQRQSSFSFLIQSKTCSKKCAAQINEYVQKVKTALPYPVFLIDFYEDLHWIDRIISDESCFLGISSNGDAILRRFEIYSQYNILNMSLLDILLYLSSEKYPTF